MAEEWKVVGDLANGLTVVAVLLIFIYVVVSGRLNTSKHTEDVIAALKEGHAAEVKALEARNTDLLGERDRATQRDEASRRELAENTAVLSRLDATIREALLNLTRRR
jgi:cell division protein FtsB